MGAGGAEAEDQRMTQNSTQIAGRRRVIALERHYHCASCGSEERSWARVSACSNCGEAFVAAVIRRAALAG
jgi:transcription elongation factor Elf1